MFGINSAGPIGTAIANGLTGGIAGVAAGRAGGSSAGMASGFGGLGGRSAAPRSGVLPNAMLGGMQSMMNGGSFLGGALGGGGQAAGNNIAAASLAQSLAAGGGAISQNGVLNQHSNAMLQSAIATAATGIAQGNSMQNLSEQTQIAQTELQNRAGIFKGLASQAGSIGDTFKQMGQKLAQTAGSQ